MPKKTRQEKIIAELRRKLQAAKIETVSSLTTHKEKPILPNISYKKSIPVLNTANQTTIDYSYVIPDLQRIGILTIIAVGFELILSILLPKLNAI